MTEKEILEAAGWYAVTFPGAWAEARRVESEALLLGGRCVCGEELTVGHAAACRALGLETDRRAVERMQRSLGLREEKTDEK